MASETFTDSGEVRSWKGIGDDRVALLLYDHSLPLERSALTLTSSGGVCVFATPPLYADPEVIFVENWSKEIPSLVQRQKSRHAFVGDRAKAEKLGASPKYADKT